MEIKTLYVVELENGEKHYFRNAIDRNYYTNQLPTIVYLAAKLYEIDL